MSGADRVYPPFRRERCWNAGADPLTWRQPDDVIQQGGRIEEWCELSGVLRTTHHGLKPMASKHGPFRTDSMVRRRSAISLEEAVFVRAAKCGRVRSTMLSSQLSSRRRYSVVYTI